MNPDLLIPLLLILVTVLISGVGIEMANTPPTSKKAKWIYRAIFASLGLTLCGLTYLQAARAAAQQVEAKKESTQAAIKSAGELGDMKGQLTSLSNLMANALTEFGRRTTDPSLKQLATTYVLLAQSAAKAQANATSDAAPPHPLTPGPVTIRLSNTKLKRSAEELAGKLSLLARNYAQARGELENQHRKAPGTITIKGQIDEEKASYNHERAAMSDHHAKEFEPLRAKGT